MIDDPAAPGGAVQRPNSCISGATPGSREPAVSAQENGTSSGSRNDRARRNRADRRASRPRRRRPAMSSMRMLFCCRQRRQVRADLDRDAWRGAPMAPASSDAHSRPASRDADAARHRSRWRDRIARIEGSPASARAHVPTRSACDRRMAGSEKRSAGRPCESSIHAGHQIRPLMFRTISVGTTLSPASFAAAPPRRAGRPSRRDVRGAGRKSCVSANIRTTSNPMSAICAHLVAHFAQVELAPHVHRAPPRPVVDAELEGPGRRRARLHDQASPLRISASDRSATAVTPSAAP